jgi:exopolysaccharide biosynthesis polyprenyl glycosylphosphotransferase
MSDGMKRSKLDTALDGGEGGAFMAELAQNQVSQDAERNESGSTKAGQTTWLIKGHPSVESRTKRMIDIIISLSGLLILMPIMGLISALIKLDSPGPAVFKQKRVGLNGKLFNFYKFRSMYQNAPSQIHKTYIKELIHGRPRTHDNPKNKKKVFKLAEDKRVTRVGRIIRRTSLDELPQLVNVLKGEMSLVGPRPAISYEVDMYKEWYKRRLSVRPGITGLWQVGGRSERTFDEMVDLDLQYIDKWSLLLDSKVLGQTIFVVLKRQGAW